MCPEKKLLFTISIARARSRPGCNIVKAALSLSTLKVGRAKRRLHDNFTNVDDGD
jgi:hypothetical protein